ncbi:MAG: SprT-like domain-containing protein [Nitrospirae bacterium]|nr:SprT-like domain-containing protein [Nitrospirota bacterium]
MGRYLHSTLSLKAHIEEVSGKVVTLKITDNTTSMLSVSHGVKGLIVRINQMFLDAEPEVINEIGALLKDTKVKTPLIRQYIRNNSNRIKKVTHRKILTTHQGRHYNLLDIYNRINEEYFCGSINAVITWGKKTRKRRVKTRRLGSYHGPSNVIRLNPVLDSATIPQYILEYVVYHEMLHAAINVAPSNGKRRVHSNEFKQREKLFKYYNPAMAFLQSKTF